MDPSQFASFEQIVQQVGPSAAAVISVLAVGYFAYRFADRSARKDERDRNGPRE